MINRESQIQQACVTWFRLQYPAYKLSLLAIPNGQKRAVKVNSRGQYYCPSAMRQKDEGLLPGASDLLLAVPQMSNGLIHRCGLWIEMKTDKGKLSADQILFAEQQVKMGYSFACCRSLDEFMNVVNNYLKP